MVNLTFSVTGLRDAQKADGTLFLAVSVRVFPEENGISVCGMMASPCKWASSNCFRA